MGETVRKVTITINGRKYSPKDRINWVSVNTESGYFYISFKGGRYYFILKKGPELVRNVVLDDKKLTLKFDLTLPARFSDDGKASTNKFKLVYDRQIDYLKAKRAFLLYVPNKIKVTPGTTRELPTVKTKATRKSRRGSKRKSSTTSKRKRTTSKRKHITSKRKRTTSKRKRTKSKSKRRK